MQKVFCKIASPMYFSFHSIEDLIQSHISPGMPKALEIRHFRRFQRLFSGSSRKLVGCMEMYGRTLPSMPQDNATYRSFAALRMTNDAIPVILSAAKDLYESSRDYILQIPQLSVKNLFSFCVSCSLHRNRQFCVGRICTTLTIVLCNDSKAYR